jgi:hypothetical protein
MKNIKFLPVILIAFFGISILLSSCELAGLNKQKDYNRKTNVDTIDAHIYKTAWAYLKARAYGSNTDTIFRRMYDGIIYSGIDTNEYTKPGRTFILLANNTITTSKTGLWATYLNNKVAAKSWKSYPASDVKNYLSYLILLDQYSHYNLPLKNVTANTLAPKGVFAVNSTTFTIPVAAGSTFNPNPNSVMLLRVSNANTVTSQLDYPIVLNETTNVTTSDLLATNGVVQVINAAATVAPVYPVQ